MGDVPVGAIAAPEAPVGTVTLGKAPAASNRAAKLAAANAALAKLSIAEIAAEVPLKTEAVVVDPSVEPKTDEPKVETKPEPDAPTTRALAQIEKQAKKFRDEQAAAKADLAQERAELARIKAEHAAKQTSFEELQKLYRTDRAAAIEKLAGSDSEEEYEAAARAAFARTKAGKADPRNQHAAAQTSREREQATKIEKMESELEELRNEFKSRDKAAEAKDFQKQFLDAAVKAIPEAPSLIGKLYAKAPDKARQALLHIGARLERENDNETPTHAEVIAEYEKMRRAELEEQGVDVDAMLRPPVKSDSTKAITTKTLDITSTPGTRPLNGTPTRAEKLAAVTAGIKKLDAELS